MPSRCALQGCERLATIQASMPGEERWRYYCCSTHLIQSGAVQSEANKKQRQACNLKAKSSPRSSRRKSKFCVQAISAVPQRITKHKNLACHVWGLFEHHHSRALFRALLRCHGGCDLFATRKVFFDRVFLLQHKLAIITRGILSSYRMTKPD